MQAARISESKKLQAIFQTKLAEAIKSHKTVLTQAIDEIKEKSTQKADMFRELQRCKIVNEDLKSQLRAQTETAFQTKQKLLLEQKKSSVLQKHCTFWQKKFETEYARDQERIRQLEKIISDHEFEI